MVDGIKINLISSEKLDEFNSLDRINFILEEVKGGKVLVLEKGLNPAEEIRLIERTMREVDPDTFIGIEIESYPDSGKRSWWERLLRRGKRKSKMSVIGPADMLKTIYKDSKVIKALIVAKKGFVGEV